MHTTIPSEPHTCQPNAIMQLSACGLGLRAACISAVTAMTKLTDARKQRAEELVELIGDAMAFGRRLEIVCEGDCRAAHAAADELDQ
jgi:hypothetical protein